MDRCYPTGCAPCDGPIDFPENPSDGLRFCIPIGSEGEQKCWVWDACVPAWRAEGPAESSIRFRGGLDPNVSLTANGITVDTPEDQWQGNPPQPPGTDLAAGDWWVVTTATAPNTNNHPDFAKKLSGVELKEGDRVFFDGSVWDYFPPPTVPYAEDALGDVPLVEDPNADDFGKPVDDPRVGGIVKTASLSQAKAGTDKCDTITPYTLCEVIDDKFDEKKVPIFLKYGCIETPDEEGPEQVAYFSSRNAIGCKTLNESTTSKFGVGQIASNYSNDANTYGDGYFTDWLTNAALAPIIDGLIQRIEELENGSSITPISSVVRTFTSSGTWTPIDSTNLQSIKVVLAGGAAGSGASNDRNLQPGYYFNLPGEDSRFYEKKLTKAESGTSAAIVVGAGGLGTSWSNSSSAPSSTCRAIGSDSSFTGNGTESTIVVGAIGFPISPQYNSVNTCPAVATRPNVNITEDVTELFPKRSGGKSYIVSQVDPENASSSEINVQGASGASGLVLVHEYYPSDWVDPRGRGINF